MITILYVLISYVLKAWILNFLQSTKINLQAVFCLMDQL